MKYRMQKTIGVIAFIAGFMCCLNNAHAFGYPTFFKKYLAEQMRDFTLKTMFETVKTEEQNNYLMAEQDASFGNSHEAYMPYQKMFSKFEQNMDFGRFGDDPFGTVQDAAERTVEREIESYTTAQKQKAEDYLKKEAALAEKEQQQNKEWAAADKKAQQDAAAAPDSGDNKEYHARTFNWLQKHSSVVTKAISGDFAGAAESAAAGEVIKYMDASEKKKQEQNAGDNTGNSDKSEK